MHEQTTYNYKVVRQFAIMTLVWGIVGMTVGVLLAAQLMFPDLTYGIPDRLAAFSFWGWQAVIVAAAITLPLGITTSHEYAELEWPIDILITLVWVAYAADLRRSGRRTRSPGADRTLRR